MNKKIALVLFTLLLSSITITFCTKIVKATELRTVTMVQSDNYLFLANPDSGKLLVFKNSGNDAGQLVQTITLGNYPSDLLINGDNLYVALSGTTLIKIIDKNTFEIMGELQTPKLPSNLAIDNNLLWVTVARNNGSNFSPFVLQLSSDGLSATSVYQPEWPQEYDMVGNEQILINPNNHNAYIACTGYSPDNIRKYDISDSNNIVFLGQNDHGALGSNGQEMNFSPDYSKIYYSTGSGGNSIYGYSIVVVNPQTLTKISSMVTGAYPNSNSTYNNLLYAGRMDPTTESDIYIFDANNISIKNYSFPFMEELVARGISAGPGLFAATNKYLYLLNQSNTTYTPIYNFLTNTIPITCTSWTYSNWSSCVNGTQTRTIVSSSPSGCVGGSPVLTQTCSNGQDLIVNNITINSDNVGNHIIVTVKNIGNQNIVMNQSVILKLTIGTNISEIQSCNTSGWAPCAVGNNYNAGIAINAYGKSTLAPGEEYSITFDNRTYILEKLEFDNNTSYLIRAMVDWTDMIDESNENNNTLTKSYSKNSTSLIYNIKVITRENYTKITWNSTEDDKTYLTYENPDNDSNIVSTKDDYTKNHEVMLYNLKPNTTYHFKIRSKSGTDNSIESETFSFTTNTNWVAGKWIKTPDSTTVYFVDSNNIRHAYPNNAVWRAYFGDDFSFVQTVTNDELTKYSLGKNVPYERDMLIKIPSVPKVYKVSENGVIQWIKTESTAKRLFGNNWAQLVHDLDESFFGDYTGGTNIE